MGTEGASNFSFRRLLGGEVSRLLDPSLTVRQAAEKGARCVLLSRPPSLYLDGRLMLVVERPGAPGPQ